MMIARLLSLEKCEIYGTSEVQSEKNTRLCYGSTEGLLRNILLLFIA